MPGEAPFRPGQGPRQFRVALRVVRVAVMRQVEMAEPRRRQEQDEPDSAGGGSVEPTAAERRPVHGLVQQAEQEGQQDAVRQQQKRPAGRFQRDRHSGEPQRRQMARQPDESLAVGPLQELQPFAAVHAGENRAAVRKPVRRPRRLPGLHRYRE